MLKSSNNSENNEELSSNRVSEKEIEKLESLPAPPVEETHLCLLVPNNSKPSLKIIDSLVVNKKNSDKLEKPPRENNSAQKRNWYVEDVVYDKNEKEAEILPNESVSQHSSKKAVKATSSESTSKQDEFLAYNYKANESAWICHSGKICPVFASIMRKTPSTAIELVPTANVSFVINGDYIKTDKEEPSTIIRSVPDENKQSIVASGQNYGDPSKINFLRIPEDISETSSSSTHPSQKSSQNVGTNTKTNQGDMIQESSILMNATDLSEKANQYSASIFSNDDNKNENELDKWKRNCQEGKFALQSLTDTCEENPDSVLTVLKKSPIGTDKQLPSGSAELTELVGLEELCRLEYILGPTLGDPNYHFLMVDASTSISKFDMTYKASEVKVTTPPAKTDSLLEEEEIGVIEEEIDTDEGYEIDSPKIIQTQEGDTETEPSASPHKLPPTIEEENMEDEESELEEDKISEDHEEEKHVDEDHIEEKHVDEDHIEEKHVDEDHVEEKHVDEDPVVEKHAVVDNAKEMSDEEPEDEEEEIEDEEITDVTDREQEKEEPKQEAQEQPEDTSQKTDGKEKATILFKDDEPDLDETKLNTKRHSTVSWQAASSTASDSDSTASLDQVVKDATAKAENFRQNLDTRRQHSLLDIVKRKSTIDKQIEEPKEDVPPPKRKKFFNFKCRNKKKPPPPKEIKEENESDEEADELNENKPVHASAVHLDTFRRRNTSLIENPVFEKKKKLDQFLNNI